MYSITDFHRIAQRAVQNLVAVNNAVATVAAEVSTGGGTVDTTAIENSLSNVQDSVTALQGDLSLLQSKAMYPSANQFNVTNNGFAYNVTGYTGDHPTLTVLNGHTYAFDLDIESTHPFIIRDSDGGSAVSDGIVHISTTGDVTTGVTANSGKTTGTLYWSIPVSVSGTYVYQCVSHSSMVGDIVIKDITTL